LALPRTPQENKSFPFIVAWGIWMARNSSIFRDEIQSPSRVAINCLGIFAHLKSLVRVGLGNARGGSGGTNRQGVVVGIL
jgi:hypothetical protein